MRTLRRATFLVVTVGLQCSTTDSPPDAGITLFPGEQTCDPKARPTYKLTFDPVMVVTTPGKARPVRLYVDPDICPDTTVTFASSNEKVVVAPGTAKLDLRHATHDFLVTGGGYLGQSAISATIPNNDGTTTTATLNVQVVKEERPDCPSTDSNTGQLSATTPSVKGSGASAFAQAEVSAPAAAFTRTDYLGLPPIDMKLQCGTDFAVPSAFIPLGRPVSFAAPTAMMTKPLRREITFAVPINPGLMPGAARNRHIVVFFQSPRAKTARPIIVANPRVEAAGNTFVLRFQSPWFGTYQVFALADGGTVHHSRKLAHRAVLGFSMGGGGAATIGFRHHDRWDAIAPMGGPSDWTWLLWFVETYALGGFCPDSNPTCPKYAPDAYPMTETYAHSMDFNHWYYEKGQGNGGSFPRGEYVQIFQDLSLMRGDPNSENADSAGLSFFARGPKSTDPWVLGDTTGLPTSPTFHPNDCRVTVEPIKQDPNQAMQDAWRKQCNKSRCDPSRVFKVPTGYYDDEYNPTGSKQVISVCDGAQVGTSASPYSNTWVMPSPDQAVPMSMALAVDLNGNGVRDENEPVIRSGHEPFDDTGEDGLFDDQEDGYDPVQNPDPSQDDYDFQMNPSGTEGDHRWQEGEMYKDVGLDGVAGTAGGAIGDVGEADTKYTVAAGLAGFYGIDPHSILRRWTTQIPGGDLHDEALARLAVWSDGGVRDLFNFAAVANHFQGALFSRKKSDGRPLHSVAFYNGFENLPGQNPKSPNDFAPAIIRWEDLVRSPSLRYGDVDASPKDIEAGDGQHVGTGLQILNRVLAGIYFSAHSWPDADRYLTEESALEPETTTQNELGTSCEISGRCEKIFSGPVTNRVGPIAITLPPGYALEVNRKRDLRYPVVFVLHGYGQDPRDLEALAIISNNFMNDGEHSYATRLPKFITVYVDGRCRVGVDGQPECIQGSFYLDATRPGGPLFATWFDEVIDYVDKNYRTLGASTVDEVRVIENLRAQRRDSSLSGGSGGGAP